MLTYKTSFERPNFDRSQSYSFEHPNLDRSKSNSFERPRFDRSKGNRKPSVSATAHNDYGTPVVCNGGGALFDRGVISKEDVVCFYCKQEGHSPNCPKLRKRHSKPVALINTLNNKFFSTRVPAENADFQPFIMDGFVSVSHSGKKGTS